MRSRSYPVAWPRARRSSEGCVAMGRLSARHVAMAVQTPPVTLEVLVIAAVRVVGSLPVLLEVGRGGRISNLRRGVYKTPALTAELLPRGASRAYTVRGRVVGRRGSTALSSCAPNLDAAGRARRSRRARLSRRRRAPGHCRDARGGRRGGHRRPPRRGWRQPPPRRRSCPGTPSRRAAAGSGFGPRDSPRT